MDELTGLGWDEDDDEDSSTQYSETGLSTDYLDRDVPPDEYLEELLGDDEGGNPDDTDLFIEPEDDGKLKFENGE
jgi:hypothetical protein